MARGFGTKPARTGKCKCDFQDWKVWDLHITAAGELIITLECQNCKAIWDTKTRAARKYAMLDGVYHFSNSTRQIKTYRDVMEDADRLRQKVLKQQINGNLESIAVLQKEIDKANKELSFLETAPLVPED